MTQKASDCYWLPSEAAQGRHPEGSVVDSRKCEGGQKLRWVESSILQKREQEIRVGRTAQETQKEREEQQCSS